MARDDVNPGAHARDDLRGSDAIGDLDIQHRRQLTRALLRALASGHRLRDLLVVEYCDTADSAGVFRQYCAAIVGDRILPQVLVHNHNWVTKWDGRLVDGGGKNCKSETSGAEDFRAARGSGGEDEFGGAHSRARILHAEMGNSLCLRPVTTSRPVF